MCAATTFPKRQATSDCSAAKRNGQGSCHCSRPPPTTSPSASLHLQARLSLSRSLVIDELLRIWSINAFLSFFRSGKFMA